MGTVRTGCVRTPTSRRLRCRVRRHCAAPACTPPVGTQNTPPAGTQHATTHHLSTDAMPENAQSRQCSLTWKPSPARPPLVMLVTRTRVCPAHSYSSKLPVLTSPSSSSSLFNTSTSPASSTCCQRQSHHQLIKTSSHPRQTTTPLEQ